MSLRVLIVQPDLGSLQTLATLFAERGARVGRASEPATARRLLYEDEPDLAVVDLHLQGDDWMDVLQRVQQLSDSTKILFTSLRSDADVDPDAESRQDVVVLRQPFTGERLEAALQLLGRDVGVSEGDVVPRVRLPVRAKITFPFVALALVLAVASAYVVSQVALDTIEDRFENRLIEGGKLAQDWLVMEEDRLLETLRLLANTQGVSDALLEGDAERLREIALPAAVNYQEEAVEILDTTGVSVLSLRHRSGGNVEEYNDSRGETIFGQWGFVRGLLDQRVEQGRDKYAGLARAPWGDTFYVGGPVFDDEGRWVGVVLIGKSLSTLVQQIREDTLGQATLYDLNGRPLASSLLLPDKDGLSLTEDMVSNILERRDDASLRRTLAVASIKYSEIVGPWEARRFRGAQAVSSSSNELGLMGVAQAETFLTRASFDRRLQVFILTSLTFLTVIVLGYYLSSRITAPLLRLVDASAEVADGNLDVQVEAGGNDEVAVLAYSFNQMVAGLKEGSLYRDLLGRSVSPEVREELRRAFASGNVRLEGQDTVATVLMSDIRDFTSLSEQVAPTTILTWLNEFFGELVPVIAAHGGVVNKFEGDAVLAFFGILPRPTPAEESAYQACRAALEMLEAIKQLNTRRSGRGEPPIAAGIGINTGPVTAGGLGTMDRLHYTIIGDTVNATARLEGITREIGTESSAVMSQHTLFALQDRRREFEPEPLGVYTVKGKEEQLLVYRLKSSNPQA